MRLTLVVILSPEPFLCGEEHRRVYVESLRDLMVQATYREWKGQQGDLFIGFTPLPRSYTIPVESLLEALDSKVRWGLNYWLDFWVRKGVTEFLVHPGIVRERTDEELFEDV